MPLELNLSPFVSATPAPESASGREESPHRAADRASERPEESQDTVELASDRRSLAEVVQGLRDAFGLEDEEQTVFPPLPESPAVEEIAAGTVAETTSAAPAPAISSTDAVFPSSVVPAALSPPSTGAEPRISSPPDTEAEQNRLPPQPLSSSSPSADFNPPISTDAPSGAEAVTSPETGQAQSAEVEAEADRPSGFGREELTGEEKQEVEKLKKRDREVRAHEQAHLSAAGSYARGGPRYEYETGPDRKRYAVGGEVGIDTSPVPDDLEATIRKAQVVRRAALAPAEPSPQDRQVASEASRMESGARQELSKERMEERRSEGGENEIEGSGDTGKAAEGVAESVGEIEVPGAGKIENAEEAGISKASVSGISDIPKASVTGGSEINKRSDIPSGNIPSIEPPEPPRTDVNGGITAGGGVSKLKKFAAGSVDSAGRMLNLIA